MHIFLQGPKNIGKTTVIRETLDLLAARRPLVLGGFFTWNGGTGDPSIYMRPAEQGKERETYRLAGWDPETGMRVRNLQVFEQIGAPILAHSGGADLIVMDELGYLESDAPVFRQAVLDTLAGDIPVLGVLRLGDVPWHVGIRGNPQVTLVDVCRGNRDKLAQELAERLYPRLAAPAPL